jgi:hypothetical protein
VPWLALSSPIFAVNIPQQETGEKKQTHTYGKHFMVLHMETTSDFPSVDFWGFELTKRNYVKETTSDFLKRPFIHHVFSSFLLDKERYKGNDLVICSRMTGRRSSCRPSSIHVNTQTHTESIYPRNIIPFPCDFGVNKNIFGFVFVIR